jgi:hypothetical protein
MTLKWRYQVLLILFLIGCAVAAEERGVQEVRIRDASGQEIGLYKESHALIIGVSDYKVGWPALPGVKRDVKAVQTALEQKGFHVVARENLTRAQLEQAFNEFINRYGQEPDNRLLFYFAGHGHTMTLAYGGEMGYIVPIDSPNPFQDKAGFLATAMDMQMIEVYAKRIQSKHALFLFDSCFAGAIFSLSRAVPASIAYKTNKPVRQFITSGSAEEQAPDDSVFVKQFIAALQGEADANKDGYVTATELGLFLQDKVTNYSNNTQHPQYGTIRDAKLDKGDFVFQLTDSTTAQPISAKTADSPTVNDPEEAMWRLMKDSNNLSDVQDFLNAYPEGRFSKAAQLKLKQLERQRGAKIEIIIDNLDPGCVVELGQWGTCGCNDCEGKCYGADFLYADPKQQADENHYYRVRFTPNIPESGAYEVFMWWPKGADRATDAPVTINHAEGAAKLTVDLRHKGSQWYSLGVYQFRQGAEGSVVIEDSETGYANADAVRFSKK